MTCMNSFAIYRLPYQKGCVEVVQHTAGDCLIGDCSGLDAAPGFVVAPFDDRGPCRTVLIKPEEVATYVSHDDMPLQQKADIDACCRRNMIHGGTPSATREDYTRDFERFHARLASHDYQKLVLAREKRVAMPCPAEPSRMFAKACCDYPRLFIALFSSPVCGTWLVATPEVLIEREGNRCHTMALAGTMSYEGDMHPAWSQKNIDEQACVATYIRDAIAPVAHGVEANGPYTVRAADLVHLRTDYYFTVAASTKMSSLIGALHPTPAVCGLPKQKALDFILRTEHTPRGYYSGYCGPLDIDGATRLFVSLRCMRIDSDSCRLYAGGGLLKESEEGNEWQETEKKLNTMQRCINP